MGRWILTVICVAGLLAAAQMAWNWRHLERRADQDPLQVGWPGAQRALRSIGVTVNAGLIAGALVAGLGGRLFMRIMAVTSADSAQGAVTDAEEVVGGISVDGTLALIVFGGLFGGLLGAFVHRLLRRWLPARGTYAGMISAVITLGAFGSMSQLLNSENRDFDILSPTWLAIVLIAALTLAFGAVLGAVYERLDRAMPEIRKSRRIFAFTPVVLVCLAGTPAAIIVVIAATAALAAPQINAWVASERVGQVGRIGVIVAALVAVGASGAEAIAILA